MKEDRTLRLLLPLCKWVAVHVDLLSKPPQEQNQGLVSRKQLQLNFWTHTEPPFRPVNPHLVVLEALQPPQKMLPHQDFPPFPCQVSSPYRLREERSKMPRQGVQGGVGIAYNSIATAEKRRQSTYNRPAYQEVVGGVRHSAPFVP